MRTETDNRQPDNSPPPQRRCLDCRQSLHPRRNARRCIPCAIAYDRSHYPRADSGGGEYGDCGFCGEAIRAPGFHSCRRQPETLEGMLSLMMRSYTKHY